MRSAVAIASCLAFPFAAAAQTATVVLPDRVFTAVPFMIDVSMNCEPPGEAPPPRGCNGTTAAWFEVSEGSAILPKGLHTLFPFHSVTLGPFTFHKPGRQSITVLSDSRVFPGDISFLAEASFVVAHPPAGLKRR